MKILNLSKWGSGVSNPSGVQGQSPWPSDFTKFLLAGSIAAAVNILTRVLFNRVMPYEIAVVPAYICGMAAAFVLNRYFVFAHAASRRAAGQGTRFILVNMVALAQVWIVGVGLARVVFPWLHWQFHADTIAHVIAVASPTLFSYFAHKHFSFRIAD